MSSAVRSGSLYIGLMSGTSLDGVDAVVGDFSPSQPRFIAHSHRAFTPELRDQLLRLTTRGDDEIERSGMAAQHLARTYAAAVNDLLLEAGISAKDVQAIGAHGQTLRHRPEHGFTVQLNAPALLAELTGIAVVADFRSRDLAAGGHGAPLVPAFHAAVFSSQQPRAVVNIGGISNISFLPAQDGEGQVFGFDCGPGNLLLDAWAALHLGTPYDADGAWGASGKVDSALLARLQTDAFFSAPPPKSTGRELFDLGWLRLHMKDEAAADVQASLVALTASGIADAIERWCPQAEEVLVCGGGAYNGALMRELDRRCSPRSVASTAQAGLAPEHVEALAFAWLAHAHLSCQAGNLPAVTGARGPRILGALYPA
ncbi:MAG: anhydro-N-acetylmuramic acid kinase [Burkholderiaceae bacterium]